MLISARKFIPFPSLKQFHPHTTSTLVAILSTSLLAWLLFTLSWGVNWHQEQNAHRLSVHVFDLDGGVVGSALKSAIDADVRNSPGFHLGWHVAADVEDGKDVYDRARELILSQKVFAAVVVSPNASSAAQAYLTNPLGDTYNPNKAITWYYEEARNRETVNQHIVPHVTRILHTALADASTALVSSQPSEVLSTLQTNLCSSLTAPQPLLWYTTENLHPFTHSVASIPTSSGGIYQIIFTFFTILFFRASFEAALAHRLTTTSEIGMRLGVPALGYAWISLNFSLVSLVFGVPFRSWWVYWMLNWVTQMGLGYPLELIGYLFGPIVLSYALLTLVVINVAPVFIDLDDSPRLYQYAKGFPLWNQVEASRYLIFGTANRLGKNFAVSIAWAVLSMVGIVLAVLCKRRAAARKSTVGAG